MITIWRNIMERARRVAAAETQGLERQLTARFTALLAHCRQEIETLDLKAGLEVELRRLSRAVAREREPERATTEPKA